MSDLAQRVRTLLELDRKPTVPEVKPLVRDFYAMPGNIAGGSLHIVLDDGNVDDDSVDFCIEWAENRGDEDGVALGRLLRRMSKTQRKKLYGTWRDVSRDEVVEQRPFVVLGPGQPGSAPFRFVEDT